MFRLHHFGGRCGDRSVGELEGRGDDVLFIPSCIILRTEKSF